MKEEENQEDGGGIDKTKNKMATSDNLSGTALLSHLKNISKISYAFFPRFAFTYRTCYE